MNEYRIKGLSCAGCAQRIENDIQQLEHGDGATLSYNSGKLTISPEVSMKEVQRILKSDGAYIANPLNQEHSPSPELNSTHDHHQHDRHDHTHHADGNHKMLKLLITSSIFYIVALSLEGVLGKQALIMLYLAATAISGYTTFIRGIKYLFKLKFNIDTLMTIALIGAVAIGEWKEATLVAILFGLNEWLEGLAWKKLDVQWKPYCKLHLKKL